MSLTPRLLILALALLGGCVLATTAAATDHSDWPYVPIHDHTLAAGNTARQRDRIHGGGGRDFIYGSHGRSVVHAGAGDDMVRIWFGRGYVDCGPGRDILYVSRKSDPKVERRHCETVSHLSDRQVHGS